MASTPKDLSVPYSEILILDPDGVDNSGHFLSQDQCLADEALRAGAGVSLLVSRACERSAVGFPCALYSVFTVNSWMIGNLPKPPKPEHVTAFETELDAALSAGEGTAGAVIFLYCGSLYHAEAVEKVLQNYPGTRCYINLFYTPFHDFESPGFRERWMPFLDRIEGSDRIRLAAPTPAFAADFQKSTGFDLQTIAHPSVTFTDAEAGAVMAGPERILPANTNVLFPAGMRYEKGFAAGARAASLIHWTMPKVNVWVRARPGKPMQPEVLAASELLVANSVRTTDALYSGAEFITFLNWADIIVLPYTAWGFSHRTSGLLMDAIILGIPVIVNRDTWLADVVSTFDCGIVSDGTAEDIADAVTQLIENYAAYQQGVRRARQAYLADNSWSRLVASILRA